MARRHGAGLSSKTMSVALTAAEQVAWKRSAAALGVTTSDLIRQSVNYYLEARAAGLRSRVDRAPARHTRRMLVTSFGSYPLSIPVGTRFSSSIP